MLKPSSKFCRNINGIFHIDRSVFLRNKQNDISIDLTKNVKINVNSYGQKRFFHKTKHLEGRRTGRIPIGIPPSTPPDKLIELNGETVPQSRLTSILSTINEDPSQPILENHEIDVEPFLVNEVLSVGRHTKILPGGRIMTFSAFVMVGTGDGTGGLGRGRGESVAQAVVFAVNAAKKNLISLDMHRGCSVSHSATYKFKRSKVVVKACRTGYGIRASPEIRVALESFGLTDICVTTTGRKTNRQALYRALFKGLQTDIVTVEKMSKMLGKKYLDLHKFFYYKDE